MERIEESRNSRSPIKKDPAVESMEKQIRDHDNVYKKEKAMLTQKIELLSIQLKDSQEREESTRRLHDTMLSALKQDTNENLQLGTMSLKFLCLKLLINSKTSQLICHKVNFLYKIW